MVSAWKNATVEFTIQPHIKVNTKLLAGNDHMIDKFTSKDMEKIFSNITVYHINESRKPCSISAAWYGGIIGFREVDRVKNVNKVSTKQCCNRKKRKKETELFRSYCIRNIVIT